VSYVFVKRCHVLLNVEFSNAPPTECRRRAGAVFVTCSRHVVHRLYMLLAFCNVVFNKA